MAQASDGTLRRIRIGVLGLVVVGLVGTAVELVLLAHDEDVKQFIPFVAIAIGVAATGWRLARPRRSAVLAVQFAMAILIVTGTVGVVLHYQANMEFQLEMDRSLSGLNLMMKVLEAKAPPALAPANMALLGLIGLAGVYRDTRGG
jgi:hypothetical protein